MFRFIHVILNGNEFPNIGILIDYFLFRLFKPDTLILQLADYCKQKFYRISETSAQPQNF